MTKSLGLVAEFIRDMKPFLRHQEDRPTKPTKHRYERRKIRQLLRLGVWNETAES